MERRKMTYWIGAVIFLLFVSLFIYSQIIAQNEEYLTQGDFIAILIQVLGLEGELSNQPGGTPQEQGINLLTSLGYTPWGGWNAGAMLTKGDVAFVLALALGYIDPPDNLFAGNRNTDIAQAFDALASNGILVTSDPPGKPEDPITESELAAVINTASETTGGQINPYPIPVSPTQ